MTRITFFIAIAMAAVALQAEAELTDNLVGYWKMEEASGVRADAHSTNDLTDNNTVTSATGKIDEAADFETSNSEFLSVASSAALQANTSITVQAWVNLESEPAFAMIVTRDVDTSVREFLLSYSSISDRFSFTRLGVGEVTANDFGAVSTGTWYHLIGWYNESSGELGISVNGVANSSVGTTGVVTVGNAEFQIGAREYSGAEQYWDGLIDEVAYWKRAITSDERTELYNSGNGLSFDDWQSQPQAPRSIHQYRQRTSLRLPRHPLAELREQYAIAP